MFRLGTVLIQALLFRLGLVLVRALLFEIQSGTVFQAPLFRLGTVFEVLVLFAWFEVSDSNNVYQETVIYPVFCVD